MKLVIITGRSGSGKSVALRVLEDLGYYCVDNIPVNLLPTLAHAVKEEYESIAISVDVRNIPRTESELHEILSFLPDEWDVNTIYLDADDSVLLKRYSETRRLHPLSKSANSLDEAIKAEREVLSVIADKADLFIDSSDLTIHQLSEIIRERILGKKENQLVLVFESFGFKHGIPKDADFVFDVRFLPNPHWVPELKQLTGLDDAVIEYLASQPLVNKFVWQITNFIATWLPHLERNNRSYVTIAIGCTGGQHRSVYVSEYLAQSFRKTQPEVQIRHRQLEQSLD